MRRIGVLMLGDESDPDQQDRVKAFRTELERLGWAEGRHIRFDVRFVAADAERIRAHSDDFVAQKPDMILANGTPILEALQKRSRTVPIVFVGVSDPLSAGFVPSMAGRAVTSRASAISSTRSAENGWSCSKKLPLAPNVLRSCSIEMTQPGRAIWLRSKH